MLCQYCSREATVQFKISGIWCCESNYARCPEIKRKRAETRAKRDYSSKLYTGIEACGYGCGRLAKYVTSSGQLCCSASHSSCPSPKKKGLASLGKLEAFEANQAFYLNADLLAHELFQVGYDDLNKRDKTLISSRLIHGVDHPMLSRSILDRRVATNRERYGQDSYSQTIEFKQRHKLSCLSSLGVDNPFKDPEIKQAILLRVKAIHADPVKKAKFFKQRRQTNLRDYGYEAPCANPRIQKQRIANSLLAWGVPFPMQNGLLIEKSVRNSFRRKEFKMPSGVIRFVQGNEPLALAELLAAGFKEEDIITGATNVPEIWYYVESWACRYFTDIFIRSINCCIEVKSSWTLDRHGMDVKMREVFELKKQATLDAGYNFELRIY